MIKSFLFSSYSNFCKFSFANLKEMMHNVGHDHILFSAFHFSRLSYLNIAFSPWVPGGRR